jgi:predicted ATPase
MGTRLSRVTIRGYKTIKSLEDFELRPLNVLIGANGAGKSNFISFFRMLSWALNGDGGGLQEYIATQGGASRLLHDGPNVTRDIMGSLVLNTDQGENDYEFRLAYAAGDTLIFTEERYRFSGWGHETPAAWKSVGAGHREAQLVVKPSTTVQTILSLLRGCQVFQFHNTSFTSRMRQKWTVGDSRWLKEDAGNLAPVLYRLSQREPDRYRAIVETLQLIVPFFRDFVFDPEFDFLQLKWTEKKSDVVFDAAQASDGMLRAMALVALLGMPSFDLPAALILDEPELGLHPYAITVIAGMLKNVSRTRQVIVSTQSATLVDEFGPDDVIVVDRHERESVFTRHNEKDLEAWLEDYSLSELWEKNVLGGRPKP